jgi:hypothetical protein
MKSEPLKGETFNPWNPPVLQMASRVFTLIMKHFLEMTAEML